MVASCDHPNDLCRSNDDVPLDNNGVSSDGRGTRCLFSSNHASTYESLVLISSSIPSTEILNDANSGKSYVVREPFLLL